MAFEIGTDGIGGLAVGFDGSGPSHDALAFSAGIARRNGAGLTVVYVIDPGAEAVAVLAPGAAGVIGMTEHEAIDGMRAAVEEALDGLGVSWDFVSARGDPAATLEQVAADRRLDVIVVGRSRSRVHRRLGSIPARLMRTAQRPIAVVP
jgi:nucleotide-binding universal stress UspA family protein